PGECFALFGPNGAGKTTLLRILATLQAPSHGQFTIFGQDGVAQKDTVREIIMLIAHGSHLYDELSATENLQFALGLRGQTPSPPHIKRALDRTGIGAFADLKIRQFSAGMKKRLDFAKTILAQPQLLLLDEPYNALDHDGVAITNQLIQETLDRDGTVFMTTHDPDKATQIATRGGILKGGHLQLLSSEQLTTDAIF
ncbi:MAG TPA: heme ABC exporter ATP-binding protein CcmA, partial [Nitrospirales bacterium]|nr:heme ABC exporter ATP-binding protein CcmA [Nitrospirales bacterium]